MGCFAFVTLSLLRMFHGYGRVLATTPRERSRAGACEIASGRTRKVALVAQRIEHWPPAPVVAGSSPAEGASVTSRCEGRDAHG